MSNKDSIDINISIEYRTELEQTFIKSALEMVKYAYEVDTAKNITQASTHYVLSSILLSICFLEAYINAIYSEINNNKNYLHLQKSINYNLLKNLFEDFNIDQSQILKKYELLLKYNNDKDIEKGHKIYQNVDKLIKLRNKITHFRAYYNRSDEPQNDEIEKLLENCFYYEDNHDLHWGFWKYPCACWAINSVSDFIVDFHNKLDPNVEFVHQYCIDKVKQTIKPMKWEKKYNK